MHRATYTDEHLPVIWMPEAYAVAAETCKLANVTFTALGDFTPDYWHFTQIARRRRQVAGTCLGKGSCVNGSRYGRLWWYMCT